MENPQENKKRETRVDYPFIVKFRNVKSPASGGWEISCVENISKSGILFKAFQYRKVNSEIELKLKLLGLVEEITLLTKVVRCAKTGEKNIYEIAVTISDIEEGAKRAFDKILDYFIKKKD